MNSPFSIKQHSQDPSSPHSLQSSIDNFMSICGYSMAGESWAWVPLGNTLHVSGEHLLTILGLAVLLNAIGLYFLEKN